MTITKTYVAFDDTEFDNEDDCLAYEKAVMKSAEAVVFLDGTKQRITEFGDYALTCVVRTSYKSSYYLKPRFAKATVNEYQALAKNKVGVWVNLAPEEKEE